MEAFFEILKNPSKLEKGLKSIRVTRKQNTALITLAMTPLGIATTFDEGGRVRGETVGSCSRVGTLLTSYFGGIGPKDQMMWIGSCKYPAKVDSPKWVMRPEIRDALESVGWILNIR